MNGREQDYYLELPCRLPTGRLCPLENQTRKEVELDMEGSQLASSRSSTGESIDEELLMRTSEMHEALRNKKMLEFQLIEARVMKQENTAACAQLMRELSVLLQTKQELETATVEADEQIDLLQRDIEQQKQRNRESLKLISEARRITVRNKTVLVKLQEQDEMRQTGIKCDGFKEHGYISIEKIRLSAENRSKEAVIDQLKPIIKEMKGQITQKEQQKADLEKGYQQLLAELKREEKRQRAKAKKMQTLIEPTCRRQGQSQFTSVILQCRA